MNQTEWTLWLSSDCLDGYLQIFSGRHQRTHQTGQQGFARLLPLNIVIAYSLPGKSKINRRRHSQSVHWKILRKLIIILLKLIKTHVRCLLNLWMQSWDMCSSVLDRESIWADSQWPHIDVQFLQNVRIFGVAHFAQLSNDLLILRIILA